jgi:hypothetical protein
MEEEVEHRRALLRLAAKGNAQARKELEQEYHASVYSEAQLATYIPKVKQPAISAAVQRTLDTLIDVEFDAA